jgi:DNA recombination protein RmuC
MMQALVVGAVAVIAGILLGYWLRSHSAKGEMAQLEQRNAEQAQDLSSARNDLARAQADLVTRAGFEALAAEREKTADSLRAELRGKTESERTLSARVKELEADLRNERQSIAEKLALLETAKETLANQFKALAAGILDEKSKTFSEGSQRELGTLLEPLKTQIGDFRKKVEEAQIDSKTGVTELKTLIGTLGNLNQALTEEAHNLATALRRDTKAQGNWGETILRNILDKSGLQEGIHYSFQQSFTELTIEGDPGRRRQTDVVVKLPGGRHIIIDSKVSLNAYNDSVNAENEKDRAEALKRHLLSLRNHCNELASRSYQTLSGIHTPDFVVMFVPIEPAFLLALQNDEALWHEAYSKGILLSGPTTVLFVLRIVEDLWRQERQARNVESVMKRGSELYDKFVGFVSNLESVGTAISNARAAYEEARKQLSTGPGNLVRQVEMLRKLGVAPRTKKQMPAKLLESVEHESTEDNQSDFDEPTLALAAEADRDSQTET